MKRDPTYETLIENENDNLLQILRRIEWSYPVPDGAENNGACPECFAGQPTIANPSTPQVTRHMRRCELGKALYPTRIKM